MDKVMETKDCRFYKDCITHECSGCECGTCTEGECAWKDECPKKCICSNCGFEYPILDTVKAIKDGEEKVFCHDCLEGDSDWAGKGY